MGDNTNSVIALSMPKTTSSEPRENSSAGHLSVHLDASQAADIPFLFEQQQKRMGPAVLVSAGSHVAFALAALLLVRYSGSTVHTEPVLPDSHPNQIVWLVQPGPGGGGGGGGNKMKEPPRKAELPGKDKITVPVAKPVTLEAPQIVKNDPPPVQAVNIPAKELAASQDLLPGAIAAPSASTLSQGSGSGGGAGTGTGTGIGPGTGSGLGPGSGGGTGGGTYRLGSGVTTPQLVREVKPQYTSDAMRAKIQGEVWVECTIKADGSVGDVQVIRSLDSTFGLDQEAIKAVRQWRFRPGTLKGEPVPVTVQVAVSFTLR